MLFDHAFRVAQIRELTDLGLGLAHRAVPVSRHLPTRQPLQHDQRGRESGAQHVQPRRQHQCDPHTVIRSDRHGQQLAQRGDAERRNGRTRDQPGDAPQLIAQHARQQRARGVSERVAQPQQRERAARPLTHTRQRRTSAKSFIDQCADARIAQ